MMQGSGLEFPVQPYIFNSFSFYIWYVYIHSSSEAHLGPIKNNFWIRYNKFPNSLYRIKFVMTNSRIRYNEFKNPL